MPNLTEKTLSQAIAQRRATASFDGSPIPNEDLKKIIEAGLKAPSGYNMQPWRFIVVRTPEQRRKLRWASFNQAKVEEASAVIVACGDADGWRTGDLEEMLRMGCEGGMPENYAEQARQNIPNYLSNHPNLTAWLNKHVMIAFTSMMLMAEVLGYDTAPMEGFRAGEGTRGAEASSELSRGGTAGSGAPERRGQVRWRPVQHGDHGL